MRFSLTLNGWPPLASHTAALLLGVALTNLSWHDPESLVSLPVGSLALSLPAQTITWSTGAKPGPGTRVHLLRHTPDTAACRLTKEPWTVMSVGRGWVLNASLRGLDHVPMVLKSAQDTQLTLVSDRTQSAAPICEAGPRVYYGQRD